MSSYYSEFWWGYLTHVAIEKCVAISKERCPGCVKGLKSSLLHVHQQASLLDKIESHLNEARGLLSSKFDEMFTDFQKRIGSTSSEEEKKVLIKSGRSFLFIVTPPSLFYGRYLTDEKYLHLFDATPSTYNPKSPPDPPPAKRKRISKPQQPVHEEIPPPKKKKPTKPSLPQTPPHPQWDQRNYEIESMYDSDI